VQAVQVGVLGTLSARSRVGRVLLHSAVEHSAVLKAAQWHAERGGTVEIAEVDEFGRVDVEDYVTRALRPGVAAAVLQAANHEVGTRQPVAEIAPRLAAAGVPLIVDAAHEILYGEPPSQVPVFTVDARLWGGPVGIAVLVVRRGARWQTPFPSDESEFGRSVGTVNVPAAVAAAASLRVFRQRRAEEGPRLSALVDRLRTAIAEKTSDVSILGDPLRRLPHLLTVSCLYADGQTLLGLLDEQGFAVSSGSSCTSDTLTPSHVLVAMGALTSGNIRLSLHPGVTAEEIARFIEALPATVAKVRSQAPGASPITNVPITNVPITDRAIPDGTVTDEQSAIVIDSRGRRCPLPILDLARALPQAAIGQLLTLLADDPAAATDVPAWCRMTGHKFVGVESGAESSAANHTEIGVEEVVEPQLGSDSSPSNVSRYTVRRSF
jgi:cysteine desulfurase